MTIADLPLNAAVALAQRVLAAHWPQARAAWLGGSVVRGAATATSDLDITVLLDGPPAPMRTSFDWTDPVVGQTFPVEGFVHTTDSLAHFQAKDAERRQPSMQRLVGESVVLLDGDGSGARLRDAALAEIAAGPKPLSQSEIDAQRYALTGVLDDLRGADFDPFLAAHAFELSARLLLGVERAWQGTGKGLTAALAAWTRSLPAGIPERDLLPAWRAAMDTSSQADVIRLVENALDRCGGRLFAGYDLRATLPATDQQRGRATMGGAPPCTDAKEPAPHGRPQPDPRAEQ
ncbi:nucleotidyltransferase domain-containing protein [Calidifontibacter sp. DB0510]|uniref:Nucleotidyltransferase domain-containing protein n=1 Tax=Metallococcus carri TaxID=1656884 RepID=A0A967AZD6_9MICO|nr:nucleotidyltransferase domain-containing protein [Metallococcus carri]NHN54538.1 nucleotidyltransferase domain-containing protein [Metallococcus carri]NOP36623.1 nucleotidyltransferase domain-containing protein [Calidifontibacter sp. DB2511S]